MNTKCQGFAIAQSQIWSPNQRNVEILHFGDLSCMSLAALATKKPPDCALELISELMEIWRFRVCTLWIII